MKKHFIKIKIFVFCLLIGLAFAGSCREQPADARRVCGRYVALEFREPLQPDEHPYFGRAVEIGKTEIYCDEGDNLRRIKFDK